MNIVLRVPKRKVRVVFSCVVMGALGAGFAAQAAWPATPLGGAESLAVIPVPHAAATEPVPTRALPVAAVRPTAQEPTAGEQAPAGQETPAAEQQTGTPPAPPAQQQQPAAGQELLTPEERQALALVEQLIREQEGVLMGTGFDYVVGGRRDPFRSLLTAINAVSAPSIRPHGLPGFLISEVEVKAVAEVQGRWHAMVTAPDQRAYFLEVGTELFDGHVVRIGPGEVVFEQIVPDLTGARRTRQVTKRLRTDGGGETP